MLSLMRAWVQSLIMKLKFHKLCVATKKKKNLSIYLYIYIYLSVYCCLVAMSCPTLLQLHGLSPTMLHCAWDFPGKHIGVGCHFLLHLSVYISVCLYISVQPLDHQGNPTLVLFKVVLVLQFHRAINRISSYLILYSYQILSIIIFKRSSLKIWER